MKVIDLKIDKPKIEGDNPNCIKCGRPALEHCYSEEGKREVFISGLCEECFDEICDVAEDEN